MPMNEVGLGDPVGQVSLTTAITIEAIRQATSTTIM
jgi:hypothetical protein